MDEPDSKNDSRFWIRLAVAIGAGALLAFSVAFLFPVSPAAKFQPESEPITGPKEEFERPTTNVSTATDNSESEQKPSSTVAHIVPVETTVQLTEPTNKPETQIVLDPNPEPEPKPESKPSILEQIPQVN